MGWQTVNASLRLELGDKINGKASVFNRFRPSPHVNLNGQSYQWVICRLICCKTNKNPTRVLMKTVLFPYD